MLMENHYINEGLKLFNQLPDDIKHIDRRNKFMLMVNNKYIRSFD